MVLRLKKWELQCLFNSIFIYAERLKSVCTQANYSATLINEMQHTHLTFLLETI